MKILILVTLLAAPLGFAAESYPERPVRFIVPMPPGGALDVVARVIGGKLTELLGQQIVIDNRAGAQGNIAMTLGGKAPPDGYTMTLGLAATLAINPHTYRNPGFDALKSFAAVSRVIEVPYFLFVNPSVPIKTMKDLDLLAKRSPGKLMFASSGSTSQLAGELFKITTKTNMVHVPYNGGGPASIALLSGEVNIIFSLTPAFLPFIKNGRLRAITVLSNKRSDILPDVPTAIEAGYPDLSNVYEWQGVVVPASTPRKTVMKLNAAVVRALRSPDVLERIRSVGLTASSSTPEEFEKYIRVDFERWGKIVKMAGIKVN